MTFAALLLLAQAAAGASPAGYDGECFYPPVLGDPRPDEVRVTCSHVEVAERGIDFIDQAWDRRMLTFSGEWDGDLLRVRSVRPRGGAALEARGVCRIDYANERVSTIACTAVAGGRSWIGNFKVSRI